MDKTYGSWRNVEEIVKQGQEKFAEALKCGGMHQRSVPEKH